ncbi:MAG: CoA transferase, partial [Rhodospirillales bacterium]|nr:CoA transferase [Rhodospirillales bacterium]
HLAASGGLLDIRLPGGGTGKAPALPLTMDGKRLPKRLDPPLPGADTRAVLAELGFSDEEIGALARSGTIGLPG